MAAEAKTPLPESASKSISSGSMNSVNHFKINNHMSELKHTPGPYFISRRDEVDKGSYLSYSILNYAGKTICEVACKTWPKITPIEDQEATANALLMAASPELLHASKKVSSAFSLVQIKDDPSYLNELKKAVEELREAIIKATVRGESI